MPQLVHASCVDYILHFTCIHFAGIAFICVEYRSFEAVRYWFCQEGLNSHNYSGSRFLMEEGELCTYQMSVYIDTYGARHYNFWIRIEK